MRKSLTKIFWNIEVWAVQKHVNLVDLVKSFPTNSFLQNLASIQKRTSPIKFDHLDAGRHPNAWQSARSAEAKLELAGTSRRRPWIRARRRSSRSREQPRCRPGSSPRSPCRPGCIVSQTSKWKYRALQYQQNTKYNLNVIPRVCACYKFPIFSRIEMY